ncbi:MAG TPA: DUF1579 domain-containing protein [Stellaceae bacterium]|nr:DUF1579 domain-containing protein [Stellaceae bacterium]
MPDSVPATDFDFMTGRWRVRHHRLKRRLANCREWDDFWGTSSARPLLHGVGNIDENEIDLPGDPYIGVTLRTHDPKTGTWRIYWFDSRDHATVDPPMVGRFENGVGTFHAEHTVEGRPVRVRFLWTRPTAETCRWEQAFSADGGQTWETNWVMEFSPA